ncbi:MAG: hypothetical protein WC663_04780 [Patescibacteria group bacterium]|jgi:hypothetical protein
MKEQFGEISQKDIMESGAEKTPGLELAKTKELDEVASRADEIADDLKNDRNIKAEQLIGLEVALGKLKVNFGAEGETMTVEELKKVPDAKENARLYRIIENAVKEGKAIGMEEVTYLTPGIARKLVSVLAPYQIADLLNLKVMTDGVAEVLGKAEKVSISSAALEKITWRQLNALFAKTNTVHMWGLEVDKNDRKLARIINLHSERMVMNGSQIDKLHELFPDLNFRGLMGH